MLDCSTVFITFEKKDREKFDEVMGCHDWFDEVVSETPVTLSVMTNEANFAFDNEITILSENGLYFYGSFDSGSNFNAGEFVSLGGEYAEVSKDYCGNIIVPYDPKHGVSEDDAKNIKKFDCIMTDLLDYFKHLEKVEEDKKVKHTVSDEFVNALHHAGNVIREYMDGISSDEELENAGRLARYEYYLFNGEPKKAAEEMENSAGEKSWDTMVKEYAKHKIKNIDQNLIKFSKE